MADAAGLTPGPIGGQPSLSFSGAPTGPSFDVLDMLPKGTPQDRLRQLRQRSLDLHAVVPPFEDIRQASLARTEAENALSRLTNHPHQFGLGLAQDHLSVRQAQRTLEKAEDEFKRIKDRSEARTQVWRASGAALAACEAWLKDRPGGTALEAVEIEAPKLSKGEDVLAGIERLRRRGRELRADLHRIASAPFPSSWAKQAMRQQVEALAARGEPDVSVLVERGANIVWPTTQVQVTVFNAQPGAVGYASMPDTLAIETWRNKEALIKRLDAEIDSEADDQAALTHEARQEREAEVMGDLLAVERDESWLVWAAMARSLPVEHRNDCAAQAILQVQLITAPRATNGPTSPGHAFDVVRGGQ